MSKKAVKKVDAKAPKAHHYDVLRAPVITEKSTLSAEHGKVVFKVCTTASKPQVKSAVEALFKVDVVKVNTIVVKGKTKTFRGKAGVRSDYKKAVVTLKPGQSIDFASGV